MERYDEDINENSFYQVLRSDYGEILANAVDENWIVCVPRAGSLPKYAFTQEDFLGHILVPSDELPGSHFSTLSEKNVTLKANVLMLENDLTNVEGVHILFDETVYDSQMKKYTVYCLERPLIPNPSSKACSSGITKLYSLRDCIDLLWRETGTEKILEHLEQKIRVFLLKNKHLADEPIQIQRDLCSQMYFEALQDTLQDPRLGAKTKNDPYLLDAVKVAVETYILHGIYKKLMEGITVCVATEDAILNRVIRNLSDIQVRDLSISPDLSSCLCKAKFELSSIDGYTTPLGKLGCLRRAVDTVTKSAAGKVISTDDLLPILVFFIIKSNLGNWYAQLYFLKYFRISSKNSFSGEHSFNVSSLEAAIEHIRSGVLFGSSSPEADSLLHPENASSPVLQSLDEMVIAEGIDPIAHYFECVRQGKIEELQAILRGKQEDQTRDEVESDEASSHPCHPLCSCDHCERLKSRPKQDVRPTVHSRNEGGFTGLHVACIFGRPIVVEMLLNEGSDLHAKDSRGATPLHYSAHRGHQNAMLLLLHNGADINVKDNDLNTPLHLCCQNGHDACAKAILFYSEHVGTSIEVNAQNNNGDTPLHLASRWGYSGIVQQLLDRIVTQKLSVSVRNKRKLTPMECAHNIHIARMITQAKSRKDELKFDGFVRIDMGSSTPSSKASDTDSLELTISQEMPPSKFEDVQKSREDLKKIEKLFKAVTLGDSKLACFYLGIEEVDSDDSEINKTPKKLCHPLCQCPKCAPKIPRSIDDTLSYVSIDTYNADGNTVLHVAVLNDQYHIVEVLLQNGGNPNQLTRNKMTPLHLAVKKSLLPIMSLLLSFGASPDAPDHLSCTPLHLACQSGYDEGVLLLLKNNADVTLCNAMGNTPVQEAEEKGHTHIIKKLRILT